MWTITLEALDSAPEELTVGDGTIWVRTRRRAYRLGFAPDTEPIPAELSCLGDTPLPSENCVLLDHSGGSATVIVSASEGVIAAWDRAGDKVAEEQLPSHWGEWRLRDACSCPLGIYALFDDGAFGQLALFDSGTLRLTAHYLQDRPREIRERIHSLCTDAMGRVYVRKGCTIYLLAETGAPSPTWYHCRPLEEG